MQLARAIAVIFLGFFASWSLQGCGGKDKDDKPQAIVTTTEPMNTTTTETMTTTML